MAIQIKIKKCFLMLLIVSMFLPPSGILRAEDGETEETGNTEETEETDETEKTAAAQISKTKMTIPIHGAKKKKLSVKNPAEGTVYLYQSSNKKIVSVGEKTGLLTGKKAGTAKVTLIKKGKKKNKIIGVCTVKVKKASITKKNKKMTVSINGMISPVVSYQNSKAGYTYESDNESVVKVQETMKGTGETSFTVMALAEGKANVTVQEFYNGKDTVVGKIAVTVTKPTLATKRITMLKGQSLKISDVITVNYAFTNNVAYDYVSADDEFLTLDEETMTAEKTTTGVNLDVYQTIDGIRSMLGTVVVVIEEENEHTPEINDDSYVDLSDYNNDYEEGFDEYDDNDYYSVGDDFVEDEEEDPDDSYEDYDEYLDSAEHFWNE